ncbi:MAG: hypothetical protein V3R48_05065 [Thermoplasmata archaeon]
MGAFDPHDLLKLNAEVEAGVPLEEAAVPLGLVSEDDPLQERVLVDLRHELQLFNAPYFDVDADPERFKDPETAASVYGRAWTCDRGVIRLPDSAIGKRSVLSSGFD